MGSFHLSFFWFKLDPASLGTPPQKMTDASHILKAVGVVFDIPVEKITGRSRAAHITEARQVTAYILRELLHFSFPLIGETIGGRDHTTVLYAYEKISKELNRASILRRKVDLVFGMLAKDTAEEATTPVATVRKNVKSIVNRAQEIKTSEDILKFVHNLELTDREKKILAEYRQGLILEKIASHFGITRERVRQISHAALIKELGRMAKGGYKINVKEYIAAEKGARIIKRGALSESTRLEILSEAGHVKDGSMTIREISKKYAFPMYKIREIFPEFKELQKAVNKKWSHSYPSCRECGTTAIRHREHGYCKGCYYKMDYHKEMVRRSNERNADKRKAT